MELFVSPNSATFEQIQQNKWLIWFFHNFHPKKGVSSFPTKGRTWFLSSHAVADAESTGRAGDIGEGGGGRVRRRSGCRRHPVEQELPLPT